MAGAAPNSALSAIAAARAAGFGNQTPAYLAGAPAAAPVTTIAPAALPAAVAVPVAAAGAVTPINPLPSFSAANYNSDQMVQRDLAAGNVAAAVGADAIGRPIRQIGGLFDDTVGRGVRALMSVGGGVLGGALGGGGTPAADKAAAAPTSTVGTGAPTASQVAQTTRSAAVADALAQGRGAGQTITPQEALAARLSEIINDPRSTGGAILQAANAIPATIKAAQNTKNVVIGQTAADFDKYHEMQLKTFQDAADAGTLSPAQHAAAVLQSTLDAAVRKGSLVSNQNNGAQGVLLTDSQSGG